MSRLQRILPLVPLVLASCADETPQPQADIEVEARRLVVEPRRVPVVRSAPAAVQAIERAELATRLAGRVVAIQVRQGDAVDAGSTLARIDDADLSAAASRARAGLQQAQTAHELASAEARRAARLHAEGALTDQDLERSVAAHRQAVAGVDAAQRQVTAAEAQLSYGILRAPFDGVVVQRLADPGDLASPGVPLLVIERSDSVRVTSSLPESDAPRVQPGDSVTVHCGDDTVRARVRAVVADDPARRTFALEVHLPVSGDLRAGRFARVSYTVGERDALFLPADAVVRRGQLQGVWVASGERALLRWLRLGSVGPYGVEVLSGLDAGTTVLIGSGLRDGARLAGG